MKLRKTIILIFIILTLFVSVFFIIDRRNNMNSKKFFQLIEQERLDGLSLTIYYLSPLALTYKALSVDDLVNGVLANHIVINDKRLGEHIDLLKQLNDVKLIPVEQESPINARLYYIFKNEKGREIFSVAMWGYNNGSVFVNGNEVEGERIFHEVLFPFLPGNIIQDIQLMYKQELTGV